MNNIETFTADRPVERRRLLGAFAEAGISGVTWSAILGGASVTLALGISLMVLGSAAGFAGASPWAEAGPTATVVGIGAAVWLVVMQAVSSAAGGYLTGRLRTKWHGPRSDETFFRDTAHGFLSWAIASIVAFAMAASVATLVVSSGVRGAATVASGAITGTGNATGQPGLSTYFTDVLFRTAGAPPVLGDAGARDPRPEATRIMLNVLADNGIAPADKAYLSQVVAAQVGLSAGEADRRVDDVLARVSAGIAGAKDALDIGRKAAASAALVVFLSLLVGAFVASAAAAVGGRHRDDVPVAA